MFDVDQWSRAAAMGCSTHIPRGTTMIQDLLLPITDTSGDPEAVAAAIALAATYGAHLSVVQPVSLPLPVPGPWGITPDFMQSEMYEEFRTNAEAKVAALRTRLGKENISWEVRMDETALVEPPRAMARQARYADLSVMAAPTHGADDHAIARAFFSSMLFESGRPVLVVPPQHPIELPIRHVVLAWKPSRESTRALHDALPLLARATSIDVVTVEPEVSDSEHGEDPGVDIATHLARHELQVNVVNLPRSGQTVATTLLRHAAATEAQLLVAGGYGHSRLREWALGGTTRELLLAIHLPILFSH
jgi:nucleotide-binding universal stress UspA family protein